MPTTVEALYDYSAETFPEELTRWRVSDREIDEQIALLGRNHAAWQAADTVQPRDSVRCSGVSGAERWNRPVLLFYPGFGVCEKAVEDALVGMRVGQSRAVMTADGEAVFTVNAILRGLPHPADDSLALLEKIPGVETLEAYRRWWRDTRERKNREDQCSRMACELVRRIIDGSRLRADPEEERAWCGSRADEMYDSMVREGIDPTVPEEGTDFLTEEQARQRIYGLMQQRYRSRVVARALVESLAGGEAEALCWRMVVYVFEGHGMRVEEVLKSVSREDLMDSYWENTAVELLTKECERYLEV